jgi:GNAT superfamily N-acetyltransferase
MLSYRTFRNTDPPVLTAIWRSRSGQRELMGPVSADLFEQLVFAKLYFDYAGLIVAREDDRPVGFAHAAFGPDAAESHVSTELGVTCMVIVRPDCAEAEVASGLLGRCEQYLRQRGAKVLYGGGIRPLNPFYLGLYGGSELPGVLDCDLVAQQLYTSHGYREIDRTLILQRDLCDFQAVIDRGQMQIRRQMIVEMTMDFPTRTWWEACTLGEFELTRFELVPRGGGPAVARATFRGMEPVGTVGSSRAAGLIELGVDEPLRHRGLAVFLLSEAFRQFLRQGIMLVETQVMQSNVPALATYEKLGFRQVGHGTVFRKQGTG